MTEISPTNITIEVNGIGYDVTIPLSSFDKLPKAGNLCRVLVYLYVREDTLQLFGFMTYEERTLFKQLITVSGIGPKGAVSILSGMSIENLKSAIACGDTDTLSRIPGIGKKTAQRIIVDLKEKISGYITRPALPVPKEKEIILNDAVRALVSLGYKQAHAAGAVEKAAAEEKGTIKIEVLIKNALKYL